MKIPNMSIEQKYIDFISELLTVEKTMELIPTRTFKNTWRNECLLRQTNSSQSATKKRRNCFVEIKIFGTHTAFPMEGRKIYYLDKTLVNIQSQKYGRIEISKAKEGWSTGLETVMKLQKNFVVLSHGQRALSWSPIRTTTNFGMEESPNYGVIARKKRSSEYCYTDWA